ncbi:MAG: DUF6017 domain-containing protein, partial [Lachnospiraceae bacterium]|nr:DUF6017 domain-containing protein [Lachnospiraceae bacterium]
NTEITAETSYKDHQSLDAVDDGTKEYRAFENFVRENIQYESLISQYPAEKGLIDEIFRTIVDIVAIPRKTVPVNQTDYPYNVVKSQFMKIDRFDVEYMLESLGNTTSKRMSERNYLITTIYNSRNTKMSHYQGRVAHDMAEGLI